MFQIILSITAILGALIYPAYLLLRRERSLSVAVLFLALLCTAAVEFFDLLFLLEQGTNLFWRQFSLAAEGLMVPLWLLFSLVYARHLKFNELSRFQIGMLACSLAFPILAIWQPADFYYLSPDFTGREFVMLTGPGFYYYLAVLVFLIISLVNLEATLRGAEGSTRWKVKFDIIGAGIIIAVLILFYSQGLLFRSLNMQLTPARSALIILGLLVMAFSRLNRGGGVRIVISRKMAMNSVVLLAVGLYLLGIGLLGGGMRYLGVSFRDSLLVVIAFLSGLGLLALILSENVRRRVRVHLHKHFYRDKYDYRNQWQDFTTRLSQSRSKEDLHKGVLSSFIETFGMGFATLYLKKHDNDFFGCVHALGMDPGENAFSMKDDLVRYMSERKWVVDVRQECPELNNNQKEFFKTWKICFSIPLFQDEETIGFILLGNAFNAGETYNYEDYDMMKALARQAASAIVNLHLAEQLSAAKEMEAAGRVAAFILHDLKNMVYGLSLMLDNARNHMDNPEFQEDMLESLSNTVARMNLIISQLSGLPGKAGLKKHETDLMHLAKEAKKQLEDERIRLKGDKTLVEADGDKLYIVMVNLLINALESDEKLGAVVLEAGENKQHRFFRVSDSGCGISDEFLRNRLFAPFMTTKKNGIGIGLYQCRRIVQDHGGRIDVSSRVGQGSVFTVLLPKEQ